MSNRVIKSCVAVATLGMLGVAGSAEAAILAQYQFPNDSSPETVDVTAAGVTANNFIANNPNNESTGTSVDVAFSTSGFAFIRAAATGSDVTAALVDDDYWSVTISASNPGEYLDLTSLTLALSAQKNSTQPTFTTQVYLQTSVGGFGTGNPTISGTNTTTSVVGSNTTVTAVTTTFDLTGAAFDNLSSITFQLRVSDNSAASSTITRFDDVTLNGDVVVPEPMSLSILGLGGLMVGRRRRA